MITIKLVYNSVLSFKREDPEAQFNDWSNRSRAVL